MAERTQRLPRLPHTEDAKTAIRLWNVGRRASPETRAKMSAAHKARAWTPERAAQLAESRAKKIAELALPLEQRVAERKTELQRRARWYRERNLQDDLYIARKRRLLALVEDLEASKGHWCKRTLHDPCVSDGYDYERGGVMRTPNQKAQSAG